MSAQWRLAREWAALDLPELPGTEQGFRLRANAECWPSEKSPDGRGRLYPVTALPPEARAELLRRDAAAIPAVIAPPVPALLPNATSQMPSWRRRPMEARMAILLEIQRIEAAGHSQRQAILAVVEQARAGTLRPDLQAMVAQANTRGGASRSLSRPTIYTWIAAYQERGIIGLAPAELETAAPRPWTQAFHRAWNRPTKPKLAEAVRAMEKHLPAGVPMPSYDAVHAYWSKLTVMEREAGRSGPNEALRFQPYKHRSVEGLEPMSTVTADGHTFKSWVMNPRNRRPFNPEVAVLMCTATRYVPGWSTGLAESSQVIREAIRRAVESHGLFGIFYTDNGSGFIADAMTSETVGLLARIGATPENSTPGRAQARGKIEAFMKVLRAAARELVTYTGRDVDREFKKRLEKQITQDFRATGTSKRVISWDDFSAFLADVIHRYNHRPHRGLPKFTDAEGRRRHMSPHDAMEEWRAKGWAPVMAPAEMLEDLFRPYVERAVDRGLVTLGDGKYFAPALAPFHGSRVRVGYDLLDPSRVWVRTLDDDRFICEAALNGHSTPQHPRAMVQIAQDKRNDRQLKLLSDKAEAIEAERRGFRVIEHAPAPPAVTISYAMPLPALAAIPSREADEARWWVRAQAILAQQAEGTTPSTADAAWLANNAGQPWFVTREAAERERAAFMAGVSNDPVTTPETTPARNSA